MGIGKTQSIKWSVCTYVCSMLLYAYTSTLQNSNHIMSVPAFEYFRCSVAKVLQIMKQHSLMVLYVLSIYCLTESDLHWSAIH